MRQRIATAAKEATLWFVCDPMFWFCALGLLGEPWRVERFWLAVFVGAWVFCVLIGCLKQRNAGQRWRF